MMKLRAAIIGCGGIANGKHLPSLEADGRVEIVAVCDIIEDRAHKAAAEYGTNARVFHDFRALLSEVDVDIVHVCTPNKSHAEITIAALEAGAHVMCEKPMAKTSADARAMVETAKRTGKKLTIGYNNRFRPDSLHLNEICRRGDLGEIYYAKAHAIRRRAVPTWGVFLNEDEQGGGPLIDIGTHALDLTLWMMNNYEPRSVMGSTYHKLGHKENAANAFGPWDPKAFTVEDSAFGFITMKNGATIVLESSWALNTLDVNEAKCTLAGTEGGADMVNGLRVNGEEFSRLYTKEIDLKGGGVAFFEGKQENDATLEARMWIDAVLQDKDPIVMPEQALAVTQILEAIYRSSETGEAVYFE